MRFRCRASLLLLLATSSCRGPDTPISYEALTIERVGERGGNGELIHRYVQVEGYFSMPQKIFTLYGGGTSVTLSESPGGGKRIETSVKVGKTGASRLITKADMYDENTLKIADRDGALLKFSDPVVIRGELRLNVAKTPSEIYVEVTEISRAPPR
jgi:hypothetical protein